MNTVYHVRFYNLAARDGRAPGDGESCFSRVSCHDSREAVNTITRSYAKKWGVDRADVAITFVAPGR